MPKKYKYKPLPKCKNYRSVKQALIGVRSLLKDDRHWCREYMAMEVQYNGFVIPTSDPQSDDVVQVCLLGAMARLVCDEELYSEVREAIAKESWMKFGTSIIGVNDRRGYHDVMRLLDATIEHQK